MSTQSDKSAKAHFPCNGIYVTHKWDRPVNVPVSTTLMNMRCTRCGLKYETLYKFRKDRILKRFHESK